MNSRFATFIVFLTLLSLFFLGLKVEKEGEPSVIIVNSTMNKAKNFLLHSNIDSAQLYFQKAQLAFNRVGNKRMELECFYYLARTALNNTKNYEEVHKYARKIDQLNNALKLKHPLWFESQYLCGIALLKESKFDKAYQLFNDLEGKIKLFTLADSTLARYYAKKGTSAYYKGDIFNALNAYTKSVDYGKSAFGEYSMFVSDQVNNLGVMNFMLNRFDEALNYYLQSEQILNAAKISDDIAMAGIYTNIGLIFKEKKDFDNAVKFLEKAKDLYLRNPDREEGVVAHAFLNIAGVYQDLGQNDKQFENIMKSKEYSEKYIPQILPKIYFQLAYYYEITNNIPMGYKCLKIALKKAQELFGESADLAYAYNNLGEYCISNNYHFSEALVYLNNSLTYFTNTRGNKNAGIARSYLSIGEYFERSGNLAKALIYYHKAIIACVDDFSNEDTFSFPHHTNSLSDEHLIDALKAKAAILKKIAQQIPSQPQMYAYLQASFQHYLQILRMIDKIRSGFISEESGFVLSANEQYIYSVALDIANQLYSLTSNAYYAEKAFLIADKAHSAHLQIMMQKKEFPSKFEFSDTAFIRENQLKKELNTLNEFILREKSTKWRDSSKIAFWNEKITDITVQLKQLQVAIINKHPVYQHLMYHGANDDLISELKGKLCNNEVIVEYFCTDSVLYSFCFLKSELFVNKQIIDRNFFNNVDDVLTFLNSPKYSKNDSLTVLKYRKAAYALYNNLLAPFKNYIKHKTLIIIPDYKLNNLPFGVLLTSSTQGKSFNFKELPYLVKLNPIRYLYSANLFTVSMQKADNSRILAFAPSYDLQNKTIDQNTLIAGTRDEVASLTYNVKEVQSILQSCKDKVFQSIAASESNFKRYASSYNSLHLAMHAIIDDEFPQNSRLVFTPNSSLTDDDLLYSYETYNLELNNDLLVLSACKTGTGKMQKGEGMLSLTRGFIFAGVKSIVTSLWTVNDKSGSDFFGFFYKNLAKHQSKSVALQNASINYLQSTDNIHAHPYYWAGFVLIGSDKPIQFTRSYPPVWLIVTGCLLIFAIIGYLVKRKKR